MTAGRKTRRLPGALAAACIVAAPVGGLDLSAQPVSDPGAAAAAGSTTAAVPTADPMPRLGGRLTARDIGLVINMVDPYSVAVGEYYRRARGLADAQVLRVRLPVSNAIDVAEFQGLKAVIEAHFGPATQALALAWVQPHAVACNSLTAALTLGLDEGLCQRSCQATRPSPYFNTTTHRPFGDLGLRPTMLLAAPSVDDAKALIDRGVAADGSLLRRGRGQAEIWLTTSADAARRVRTALYPPAQQLSQRGVRIRIEPESALREADRVLIALAGSVRPTMPDRPEAWLPGALADHLTSAGGSLLAQTPHGQTTVLEWIGSGATASHGTVSEPCNHLQKFPHPQVLLLNYLQGASAIEAYWRSVAWPAQSLFVGEPLAAPFGPPAARPAAPR
jgi:uncharacterized protein (TIGR03790 family)